MKTPLLDYIKSKIAKIETGNWGGRPSPFLRMSDDAGQDAASGVVRGRIDVLIATRSSGIATLAKIELGPLSSEGDVDDAMADTLSKVLRDHSRWPR